MSRYCPVINLPHRMTYGLWLQAPSDPSPSHYEAPTWKVVAKKSTTNSCADLNPVVVRRQLVAQEFKQEVACRQLVAQDVKSVVVCRQLVPQGFKTVVVCRQLRAQDFKQVVACRQLVAQEFNK